MDICHHQTRHSPCVIILVIVELGHLGPASAGVCGIVHQHAIIPRLRRRDAAELEVELDELRLTQIKVRRDQLTGTRLEQDLLLEWIAESGYI